MSTAPRSSNACPNVSAANLAIAADGESGHVGRADQLIDELRVALRCLAREILCTIGPQLALLHERAREAGEGADGSGRTLYDGGHQVLGIPTSDRVWRSSSNTEFEQFEPSSYSRPAPLAKAKDTADKPWICKPKLPQTGQDDRRKPCAARRSADLSKREQAERIERDVVGVRGFEPPTPASRTQYSTRLSYTPKNDKATSQHSTLTLAIERKVNQV